MKNLAFIIAFVSSIAMASTIDTTNSLDKSHMASMVQANESIQSEIKIDTAKEQIQTIQPTISLNKEVQKPKRNYSQFAYATMLSVSTFIGSAMIGGFFGWACVLAYHNNKQ
jgi:hypothetical protein